MITYWGDAGLSPVFLGHDDMCRVPRVRGECLGISDAASACQKLMLIRRLSSPNCLLCLVRNDLDVVKQHLACHITTLGAKGEHASVAVLEILVCVLVVLVLLEACR